MNLESTIRSRIAEDAFVSTVAAAGPYLNLTLNRVRFAQHVVGQVLDAGEDVGKSSEGAGRVVVIDYCSPNIAKPFHVGHLRSTIIGASLYRIYQKLGYRAIGINHLGDWGTQFGKQIVALKRWGESSDVYDLTKLNALYVQFHQEQANADPKQAVELTSEARDWFRKQEDGDPAATSLWKVIRQTSVEYLERVFVRLNAVFDHTLGESFFNDKTEAVIKTASSNGLTELSDGATIINLQEHGIDTPALLQKSDGTTLYITRDIAAAIFRATEFEFDKMVYVVGNPQSLHFKQLFKCLELLGYSWHDRCHHVGFGKVRGMQSRTGNVVYLESLLDEARDRAQAYISKACHEPTDNTRSLEIAEAVGIAAVVFGDLCRDRIKDYDFDWENSLSFEGDTGPYLLNAHARIVGIINRSGIEFERDVDFIHLTEPHAHRLITMLSRYSGALSDTVSNDEPSVLANYLLDLAHGLHSAYGVLRVKGEEAAVAKCRLALFVAVKSVLADGIKLLGMTPLEEM